MSMNCPKCGKAMFEEPKCPGLWRCMDYRTPLNDGPPYEFACTGKHLTAQFYADLNEALERAWLRDVASKN